MHTSCALFNVDVGLSKFLEALDERGEVSVKETKKHVCERKKRIVCSPTKSTPPTDAPSWTVSKEWLKSKTLSILRQLIDIWFVNYIQCA